MFHRLRRGQSKVMFTHIKLHKVYVAMVTFNPLLCVCVELDMCRAGYPYGIFILYIYVCIGPV